MKTIALANQKGGVIVPVQAQYLAAKGLEQLMRTIARVRRQISPRLTVDGILLTMMDSIERTGIAEPLIVRPHSEGGYEIISGHRRDYCAKGWG